MENLARIIHTCRQFLDQLPLVIHAVRSDADPDTLYVSPAVARMLGDAPADFRDRPALWSERIHPDDRAQTLQDTAPSQTTAAGVEIEYRMSTRDGRVIRVSEQAHVIDDAAGNARYRLGMLTDITALRDAGQQSGEGDSGYSHLVEYTSDLVVKVDAGGRFLFVSPSYCVLFDKTERELLGQGFMPLVHEDDRESTERAMQALYRPPHSVHLEQRAMTKSGWRWLAWTDNAILDADGNISAVVGVGRDITERKRMEQALQASERRLHETMQFAGLGHWELVKDGLTSNWSEEIYDIFGIAKTQPPGPRTLRELVHPDDRSCVLLSLEKSLDHGIEHHVDYRIRRPDGEERWVECRAQSVPGKTGGVEKLAGFLQDITERKQSEAALRRSEERFRVVATATNDLIYEWRTSGDKLLWYGDIDRTLGYRHGEFPRTLSAWIAAIHPEDRGAIIEAVRRIRAAGGTVNLTYRIATAQGSWRTWRDTGRTLPTEDDRTRILIGGCSDITEQKRAAEEIHHLAFHDALTGLPNRVLFKDELNQTLENYRRNQVRFALHCLDLDYFKDINDSLGHQVGDELLRAVVTRVKEITRGIDLFARLGGDEFALIQTNIDDAAQASLFAAKVIRAIGAEFDLQDKTVHITTSIGIVVPEDSRIDADDLLKKADTALYKAKDAGRGTYAFFQDAMTIKLQREMELVHCMVSAIRKDQLFLEYQAQYDLASRKLIGLEALIRWNHPQRGRLMPDDFLPIAENRGLIGDISDWALQTACRQAQQWADSGLVFGSIAVNLCARQVNSDDFLDRTVGLIRDTGLDPRLLELEFTETVLMQATEATKRAIRRLSELGVRFAIDDFGTGFSSLSYLKNFHADKIKIDREFIRDLERDPNDAEIVKATIALGHALGLETLAEGVETPAQLAFLEAHGCGQAQGFHFARPVSSGEMTRRLENRD